MGVCLTLFMKVKTINIKNMKKLVFLLFLLCLNKIVFTQSLYNNASAYCIGYYPTNQSVETSFPLCGLGKAVTWDNSLIPNCNTSNPKFYYNCELLANATVAFDGLKGPQNGSVLIFPNSSTQIKIYGPYTNQSLAQVAQSISLGLLPFQLYSSSPSSSIGNLSVNLSQPGKYVIEVSPDFCTGCIGVYGTTGLNCSEQTEIDCATCITSFSPESGKYIVSAWVKEDDAAVGTVNYTNSKITVSYNGTSITSEDVFPSGQIIDGWQRMEGEIEIPVGTTDITITLTNLQSGGISFFDDIRFFPFDGSMMSYVYDPETLRLVAELDERNYAKFYEYDEEGKLIRVKKETERGVMTIQENRNNIKK